MLETRALPEAKDTVDESSLLQEGKQPCGALAEPSFTLSHLPKSEKTEDPTCRICFDVESGSLALLHPCKCAGSAKFIHEECLKAWLAARGGDLAKSECEVCKTPFRMNLEVKRKFSPRDACKDGLTQCLFTPLLLAVLGMLILIMYLLFNKYLKNSSSTETKGYTVALLITCGLSACVIAFLIAHTLRDACFARKVRQWRIFSQDFLDVPSSLLANPFPHPDLVSGSRDDTPIPLPPLLILPTKLRFNGKKVILPPLCPPTMSRVMTQGKYTAFTPKLQSRAQTPCQYRLVTDPATFLIREEYRRQAITPGP